MPQTLSEALQHTPVHTGENIDELSRKTPLLMVFLRHAGCPFCREALAQLRRDRGAIEAAGTRIVLVHMTADESAKTLFAKYGLDDVPRVADPERKLYAAFELKRGTAGQVMGPRVWWKGFRTTFLRGHLPGIPEGDVFQLPGTFLVADGEILRAFRTDDSAGHPDYAEFATCELPDRETASDDGGRRSAIGKDG
jgi:peroxiredoxin